MHASSSSKLAMRLEDSEYDRMRDSNGKGYICVYAIHEKYSRFRLHIVVMCIQSSLTQHGLRNLFYHFIYKPSLSLCMCARVSACLPACACVHLCTVVVIVVVFGAHTRPVMHLLHAQRSQSIPRDEKNETREKTGFFVQQCVHSLRPYSK